MEGRGVARVKHNIFAGNREDDLTLDHGEQLPRARHVGFARVGVTRRE